MVTNKSQSDSSFCVIINIFENKGLFMFILTEICGGGILMLTLCKHCAFLKKEKISVLYIIL